MRSTHTRLHASNVVRNAPELHDVVFQSGDRKSRARVGGARLADRSWIQQVTGALVGAQSGERLRRSWTQIQDLQIVAGIGVRESTLMMRMAEEGNSGSGVQQPFQGLRGSKNVLVLILKRAVHQNNSADLQRAVRQFRKPFQVVGR